MGIPFSNPLELLYTRLFTMKRVSLLPVPAEVRVRFQTIPIGVCAIFIHHRRFIRLGVEIVVK
jgi:hypothetical protein